MFGGVYAWAAAALAALTAILALRIRPALSTRGASGALDLSLLAIIVVMALQLLPLPYGLVAVLSPGRIAFLERTTLGHAPPGWLPLSIDPAAGLHALMAAVAPIVVFWCARGMLPRTGARRVLTILAAGAAGLVLLAVAQAGTGGTRIYGLWQPYDAGARPFGPFVNRNHFGAWSVLAFFLCLGAHAARLRTAAADGFGNWRVRAVRALDGRILLLRLALLLLAVGIALTASRATLLALACGAGYVAATASRRGDGRVRWWQSAAVALAALAVVLMYGDAGRLLSRWDETMRLGLAQRRAIWSDAAAVIREFPIAGTGAGTFSTSMELFQRPPRTYFWNEAHNHYLQIAAEGGLLLTVPAAVALGAFGLLAVRRGTRRDPARPLRTAAAAAIVAALVHSVWETALALPANAMLLALAAALVVQEGHRPGGRASRESPTG